MELVDAISLPDDKFAARLHVLIATYLKPAIENGIALCTKLATFISDVISKVVKEAGMLAYSRLLDDTIILVKIEQTKMNVFLKCSL